MTDHWHQISLRPTETLDGFAVSCSCGWKSDIINAPPGMENWNSAQDVADAVRKDHARSVSPENAIWTGKMYVRLSDYPADHFINQPFVTKSADQW
jgi:hypothetical protein